MNNINTEWRDPKLKQNKPQQNKTRNMDFSWWATKHTKQILIADRTKTHTYCVLKTSALQNCLNLLETGIKHNSARGSEGITWSHVLLLYEFSSTAAVLADTKSYGLSGVLLQLQGMVKSLQYFISDCFLMLRLNTFT